MLTNSKNSISIVFKYAKKGALLKIIVVVLQSLILPFTLKSMKIMIDNIIGYLTRNGGIQEVITSSAILILIFFLFSLLSYIHNLINISMEKTLSFNLSRDIVDKFRKIEYAKFEDSKFFDTLQRMRDNPDKEILAIFNTSLQLISIFISVISLMILFSQVSIFFALFYLFVLMSITYFDFRAINKMNDMFNKQSYSERKMEDLRSLISNKNSLYELRVNNAVDYIKNKLREITNKVLDERMRTTVDSQKYSLTSRLFILIWFIGVLIFLIKAVIQKEITIGVFVSLSSSIQVALSLTENLSYEISSITQNGLTIEHFKKFMNCKEEQYIQDKSMISLDKPFIEFRNVRFTYPGTNKEVLSGVSFIIHKGQTVGLVGENGSGKSTIIKLLLKLYPVDSGEILIYGENIEKLSRKYLSSLFGVIFQDFAKYEISVRENVALSNIKNIDNDIGIRDALNKTDLKFLSENIDINLGKIRDDGVDISGGQWQRLAISRAYFSNTEFIIFDEPTASLDPIAESEMIQNLSNILSNRGCIFISHRLNSTKLADKILVISGGKIVEEGNHTDLMYSKGIYAEMYETQSFWYTDKGKVIADA